MPHPFASRRPAEVINRHLCTMVSALLFLWAGYEPADAAIIYRWTTPQGVVFLTNDENYTPDRAGVKPFPLISDLMHSKNSLHLIEKSQIQLYGDSKGPSFLEDDGARFRRFSRSLVKEAEMLDRMNALYTNCSRIVFFHNLLQATA